MEMYRNMGLATFELVNLILMQMVSSTVGSQVEVTMASMILKLKALDTLSNHPNIDKDNVSITGRVLVVEKHYSQHGKI